MSQVSRRLIVAWLSASFTVAACGTASPLTPVDPTAGNGPPQTPTPTPTPAPPEPLDSGVTPPVSVPDAGQSLGPRYRELKGVLHVHSVYSHDACDGQGFVDGGLNLPCLAELRAAPCQVGLDVVNLSDHPAHMSEFEPVKNLLYDASLGDELVMGADGASPVGNFVKCPDGRKVLFTYGYEALHTLPLIFERHPKLFEAYATDRASADVKALVADLKQAGALVALAHSEEADLTTGLIIEGGADVMEWYNPHGNFKKTMGTDKVSGNPLTLLSFFSSLDPFLLGSTSGAHPDLAYLSLLKQWPDEGFTKWREVQQTKFVPGVLGSDVHRNISIDPVCKGSVAQALCTAAAGNNRAALGALLAGGQLMMSDHQRLDTYERLMRWLRNVILTNDLSPSGVRAALAQGRSYGVFSVFGEPTGFQFEGDAAGLMLDLGALAKGPITLRVKVPEWPTPTRTGVPFSPTQAQSAQVRATLFRTDSKGTVEVATSTSLGATLVRTVSEPGAYHVELWVKPKHLTQALGPQTELADREFLWVITNPIRVAP